MGWFRKIFEKDDWRFVGKVKSKYRWTSGPKSHRNPEGGVLTYYLYENQHGERKFDVIDSDEDRGDIDVSKLPKTDWVFRNEAYRDTIHPWLNGFRNPEFPTYDKVPNHDFKRLLKGDD